MKKVLVNYGGILLFYMVLVVGMIFLCTSNSTVHSQKTTFNASCVYCK